jgi:hypothetical protein
MDGKKLTGKTKGLSPLNHFTGKVPCYQIIDCLLFERNSNYRQRVGIQR